MAKAALWSHQKAALAFIDAHPSTYLNGWMGVGKSRIVVEACNMYAPRRVLVLCPQKVVGGWERQFDLYGTGEEFVVSLGEGPTVRRAQELKRAFSGGAKTTVALVNLEAIIRPDLGSALLREPWDMLVFDEIHKLKAPGGAISRVAMRLKSKRRIGLSGTPMPHSPLDIYGQYRALDKAILGKSFVQFRARYAIMGGYENHQVIGWRAIDELQERVGKIMFKMPKSLLTLPPVVDTTLPLTLSNGEMLAYRQMKQILRAEIARGETTAANGLVKLLRLQQITSGYLVPDGESVPCGIGTTKLDALTELLEDIDPGERVVVFARFTPDVQAIKVAAKNAGREAFELSGKADEREAWKLRAGAVLATQIQAGGTGIDDLAPNAAYGVYYSIGYSLSDYIQSHERLHRPGQEKTTTFIHLVAKGTIDETIMAAIDKRQDLVNSVLEGIRGDVAA